MTVELKFNRTMLCVGACWVWRQIGLKCGPDQSLLVVEQRTVVLHPLPMVTVLVHGKLRERPIPVASAPGHVMVLGNPCGCKHPNPNPNLN